jgi:cytochrome c-type biogenesis protein CcmH/NrfG
MVVAFQKAILDEEISVLPVIDSGPTITKPEQDTEENTKISVADFDSETEAPLPSKRTVVLSDTELGGSVVESADTQSEEVGETKPRRRWKWWQIALGIIIFVLCCFVGLVGISQNQQNRQAAQATQQASKSTDIDKPAEDEALKYVLHQVEENPDEPFYYIDLASVYLDLGRNEEAIEAIRDA